MKFLISLILIILGIGAVQDRPDLVNRFKNDLKLGVKIAEKRLGGLAPLPGSITEGTSTAGWTDDGSIVRLNTAADNVGIGTVNPSQKLQVQGSAYITSNLLVSGGTFNFSNGPATTTITQINNGNLGFGTTTPNASFAFQGGLMAPGTTTLGTLVLASSTVQLRGVNYILPPNDGTNGQALITNGQANLSFGGITAVTATSFEASATPSNLLTLNKLGYSMPATRAASSTVLAENGAGALTWLVPGMDLVGYCQATAATSTCAATSVPNRVFYRVMISIASKAATAVPTLNFNADTAANYGSHTITDGVADAAQNADTNIDLAGANNANAEICQVDIWNRAASIKHTVWNCYRGGTGSNGGTIVNGGAQWNNTSVAINEILLSITQSTTFGAGSFMAVYAPRSAY